MQPLLTIEHLSKVFPGQVALDDVSLEIRPGSTHALVGQNGSGKSTLIKILAGYHAPEPGYTAVLDGANLRLGDGHAAAAAGIRFVHQDLGLVNTMDAVENIAMGVGYTTRRGGRIDWRADVKQTLGDLFVLGFDDFDVRTPVGMLAPSQKTAVALARAMRGWENGARLLVLDEPTASLPGADVERLFEAIRRVKERGVAILYVSHHLDEVFEIADEVSILRDGRRVTTKPTADLDHERLIELMIGHKLERTSQGERAMSADVGGLRISGLTGGSVRHVDLHVLPGEIVGVAGITGSGREMLAKLITGQAPSDAGEVVVDGKPIPNFDPRAAIQAGMAFVPADRASHGVIPFASVSHNLTLANVWRNWRRGRLDHSGETDEVQDWIGRLDVKTSGTAVPISVLSGGNQQKVLFGRSLRLAPSVLVLDEPTSGVDVAAKDQILRLIDQAAQEGTAVVVVSTDTDELVRVAHRIIVMVDGSIIDELIGADMTADNVERSQLSTTKTGQR